MRITHPNQARTATRFHQYNIPQDIAQQERWGPLRFINQEKQAERPILTGVRIDDVMQYAKNGSNSGTGWRGYLIAIDSDDLLYYSSGPMASFKEIRIPVSDIDLESLSYYHQRRKQWVGFRSREPIDEA